MNRWPSVHLSAVSTAWLAIGPAYAQDSVQPDVLNQTGTFDQIQTGRNLGFASFTNGATLSGTFDNTTWTANATKAYSLAVWSGSFTNAIFDSPYLGLWRDARILDADFTGASFIGNNGGKFANTVISNSSCD